MNGLKRTTNVGAQGGSVVSSDLSENAMNLATSSVSNGSHASEARVEERTFDKPPSIESLDPVSGQQPRTALLEDGVGSFFSGETVTSEAESVPRAEVSTSSNDIARERTCTSQTDCGAYLLAIIDEAECNGTSLHFPSLDEFSNVDIF